MGQLLGTIQLIYLSVFVDVIKMHCFTLQSKVGSRSGHCFFLMLSFISSANNEGLEVLDLSWNHLRMKGAVALCAGLKVTCFVRNSFNA